MAEGLSQHGLRRTAAALLVVLGLLGTALWVRKPELPGSPANDRCIHNFREERLVSLSPKCPLLCRILIKQNVSVGEGVNALCKVELFVKKATGFLVYTSH